MIFMDAHIYYYDAVTPIGTLTGLHHLESEIVGIRADNDFYWAAVDGGEVELKELAHEVFVGLVYESELETMPLDAPDGGGMTQVAQRVSALVPMLYETVGGYMAIGESEPEPLTDQTSEVSLFTGNIRRTVQGGTRRELTVKFKQIIPLPMTVLGVIAELEGV